MPLALGKLDSRLNRSLYINEWGQSMLIWKKWS
jgi:hypothetical protein